MFDFVILVGPPGTGKTYLGLLLRDKLGLVYTPLEPELYRRFGTGAEFQRHKAEALKFIEASLEKQRADADRPVVVESTGVSDREMLGRFAANYRVLFVQVIAPQELCVRRVESRTQGGNLNNDAEFTRKFYDYWVENVAPQYDFDLIVENHNGRSDEAIAEIGRRLTSEDLPRQYPSSR